MSKTDRYLEQTTLAFGFCHNPKFAEVPQLPLTPPGALPFLHDPSQRHTPHRTHARFYNRPGVTEPESARQACCTTRNGNSRERERSLWQVCVVGDRRPCVGLAYIPSSAVTPLPMMACAQKPVAFLEPEKKGKKTTDLQLTVGHLQLHTYEVLLVPEQGNS